jgi:hypothetical protein
MKTLAALIALAAGPALAPAPAWAAAPRFTVDDAGLSAEALAERLGRFAQEKDDLAARLIAQRMLRAPMSRAAWELGRASLMARPGVGWDVLLAWDRKKSSTPAEEEIDALIARADKLLLARQFDEAFARYQAAAQAIKRQSTKGGPRNDILYQSVLHGMARALYGARRFAEAVVVYRWIAPPYPFFRQAQFEKTWAGFQAGQLNYALGALATQYSSYFSLYPSPESYLVQAYVYKRLCRADDLALAARSARSFAAKLADGSYGFESWARGEIETLAYSQLMRQKDGSDDPSAGVDAAARGRERARIRSFLEARFSAARPGLISAMKSVLVYLTHGLRSAAKDLAPLRRSPSRVGAIGPEMESWPVDDAEDWLDELGLHVFGGETKCASPRSR